CLRNYILRYFGENGGVEDCGHCGNCSDDGEMMDITIDAQKVFSCIYRMKERFGITIVADVLKGAKNKKVRQFGFEDLSTYGLLSDRPLADIKTLIQQLAATGYLQLTDSTYPVVKLTPTAMTVLRGQQKVWQKMVAVQVAKPDDSLFDLLRQLRKQIAAREQVPPYVVFADSTLKEMSQYCPVDETALRRIKGVGEVKLERYGNEFLALIQQHAVR
ncbi:MAG: RQC domain-containing protein, partial [Negativicutes bacterium]|nr:RQC domain-containing protein [Negativicutes bacterium]